jgi:hypothetical protein
VGLKYRPGSSHPKVVRVERHFVIAVVIAERDDDLKIHADFFSLAIETAKSVHQQKN